MTGSQRRRALTIGVSAFSDGRDLPFTSGLVAELASALEAVGYLCTSHPVRELPSAELGGFVARELESAEPELVQVVHVLTHGESGEGDATVYALGSDGTRHPHGDIAHWLNTVQNSASRPLTLFLLDLCHAGSLARMAWQSKLADGRTRAWVIAATEGNTSAYDGRFTQAVINVLRAAANGELDIDPTKEHIPLQVVAPAIRREVNRLTQEADGYRQDVTASVVDISAEVDPPFFPNPRYAPGNRDLALRASLDPGLVPFLDDLDEGLDARHFIERGSGFDGMIGCFAGREAQLKQLSPWLNGKDPGNLGVITGSPGVGKSALLGVLVCAAHPILRDRTKNVWERAAQAPYRIEEGFAAIHARQRSLPAIVASLAAQLELGSQDLIDGIRALPVRPVIVVDALDEAANGVAVLNELLLPLSAVARVLVGTRRYDQYAPLLHAADFVVDLDDVAPQVLQEDLYRYVSDLLGATRYREHGAIRGAFATEVAKTLAAPSDAQWGEFLVAGLYTRYLITAHEPVTDPSRAERVGAAVPRTLPEVLDLDLEARPDQPWLRPVLSALAHAKGQGMPASVLARAVTAFASEPTNPPTHAELREALDAGRFYLRQAMDSDHTTLYRLFHQGLADHLRGTGIGLLNPLLDGLGPSTGRDWSAAEPYLLRHAIQHAREEDRSRELFSDPGFILTIDPDMLEGADDPWLQQIAVVLQLTRSTVRQPEKRRATLALNAARAGLTELAAGVANSPGKEPLPWQPLWSAGRPLATTSDPDATIRFRETGSVTDIACGLLGDDPIAAIASDRRLHFFNLRSGKPIATALIPGTRWFVHVACTAVNGRSVAVSVNQGWNDRLVLWDVEQPDSPTTLMASGRSIRAISCTAFAGIPVAIVAIGRRLRLVSLADGAPMGDLRKGHIRPVTSVACTTLNGQPITVSGGRDRRIRLWEPLGEPLTGHERAVTAIACGVIDGRAVAVSAGEDYTIRIWDIERRQQLGEPLSIRSPYPPPDWLEVRTLADGTVVAIACGARDQVIPSINVWDLRARRRIRSFDYSQGFAACAEIDGRQVLVVAGDPGTVDIWNLEPTREIRRDEVAVNRCALIGRHVMVASIDGSVACRDLVTGKARFKRVLGNGVALAEIREESFAGRSVVVLTDTNGTSRLWDPPAGRATNAGRLFPARPKEAGYPAAVAPIGERLKIAKGTPTGHVHVSGNGTMEAQHDGPVTALAAMELAGRMLLFSGGADATVQVCDVLTRRRIALIDNLLGPVDQLEVSADGYLLIVAGGEVVCGKLRL